MKRLALLLAQGKGSAYEIFTYFTFRRLAGHGCPSILLNILFKKKEWPISYLKCQHLKCLIFLFPYHIMPFRYIF